MPAPKDRDDHVLQVVRPVDGGAQAFTNASQGVSTPIGSPFKAATRVVGLRVTAGEIRYRFGKSDVAALATDHRLRIEDGFRSFSILREDGAFDTHVAIYPLNGQTASVDVEEFS